MAQQQPARRKIQTSKTPVSIPDKLYFRIGDVARLCSLPAYVLRFWETEFPQLKPNKGGTGQRLYRKRDVEMVLEIKRLLYDEGFTIPGARRLLTDKRRSTAAVVEPQRPAVIGVQRTFKKSADSGTVKATPGKPLATQQKVSAPAKAAPPKIKELREEMRALLTLLGSDPGERKPVAAPARRDTRKSR